MKPNGVTCTRGPWCWGTLSGSGIQGYELQPICRVQLASGREVFRRGQLYGVRVATHEEADAYGLSHGYTQRYSRNLTHFVMSRAARRRGIKATDFFYLLKAGRTYGPDQRAAHGAAAPAAGRV